ncbi:exo-alpha-sialidase [Candidatus Acetothermia bacterium]|nr:exo-alpha-sialidase [Candidatus Acetothermia bacterium]
MPPVILGPRCNRRVTCSPDPHNDRSESALAVNPNNPYNMVGSSKRFTDPHTYAFALAAYYTFDGGQSWNESPQPSLLVGWDGTSDPAVAWDNLDNVYLVALPFGPPTPSNPDGLIGIAVYKSTDGGRTWGPPNLIHSSSGDDKQWAAGDLNPTSPHYGNVYAAWDDGDGIGVSKLAFARTTDHGVTWKGIKVGGIDQPAGTALPSINDSGAPELSVAADGTIYIVWVAGNKIKFVKSTNGGDSFTAPAVVASGISPIPSRLPGGTFRTFSPPTGCTGTGNHVIFAWADYREMVSGARKSRIYYRHSTNGGNTWQGPASGQPLLTGAVASAADQHDFHPQLISTPSGEIGCAFYEFGPKGGGTTPLIDVVLAVSTDNGATFPNRVTVTDQPWDPTVDEVWAHGDPNVTFIGDYFGLDASRLGFFPFWTDTRTGVQEIFTARVSVNPADVYIRDSSSDVGDVPSPGFHWEAPDLIVRRQPDGNINFVNEDLLRDGVTDHYVYASVKNRGPNTARNVRLAVTVGNYPSLIALPGTEFRYPQDWYSGDWDTSALKANHLFLGESTSTNIANGATQIIGPVLWPAAQIPPPASWHPCLLAEVRADNDDSAGGINGCDIDVDPDPCAYGSYFWGNNNICQRNLSYATIIASAVTRIELPFLVGSPWSTARFLEVIIDKGKELAKIPMTLRMKPVKENDGLGSTIHLSSTLETSHGTVNLGDEWKLTRSRAVVGFSVGVGQQRWMTLSFTIPPQTLKAGIHTQVEIFQRNEKKTITGSVILDLMVAKAGTAMKKALGTRKKGGKR